MFNILPNGRFICNGFQEPTKNYPQGYKTSYVEIIDNITSDEKNNKGCIIGQKLTALGKRCGSNKNVDNIVTYTFLKNGQFFLSNFIGTAIAGTWSKTDNVITMLFSGIADTDGKIGKYKTIFTIDENNNFTDVDYVWKCKKWIKDYSGEDKFVAPLDCE